jgi:hypothetical protein
LGGRDHFARAEAVSRSPAWRAGYTVVTRNVQELADLGVIYLDPFEPLR